MSLSYFRKKKISNTQKTNCSPVYYDAFALSDVGLIRKNNEDSVLFIKPNDNDILQHKGVLGVIADGMGGHNYGEIASQIAVNTIAEHYFNSPLDKLNALKNAVNLANQTIYEKAQSDHKFQGMGTTCTAAVLHDHDLIIAHAGDSRAYFVNNNKIMKLTTDHTYSQYLLDNHIITEDQYLNHPERNIITKSLGLNPIVQAEFLHRKSIMVSGGIVFLCGDGLYEYLSDNEIKEILTTHSHDTATEVMISKAKKRGGHDNISVLIIRQIPDKYHSSKWDTKKVL